MLGIARFRLHFAGGHRIEVDMHEDQSPGDMLSTSPVVKVDSSGTVAWRADQVVAAERFVEER